jgi:NTE family protein
LDRSQLKDATKILVQINNLNSIERMQYCGYRHLHQTRYIAYGVISFDKGKEIIRKGEEATFAVYEQLKKVYSIQKNQNYYSQTVYR